MPDEEKLCTCQTPMDNVHGIWLCSHCDQECEVVKPCVTCAWYGRSLSQRLTTDNP